MQIPNNILKALTREIDGLLHEGSMHNLLGEAPTYDDLKMITRQYIDSAAADRPVPARGKAHGLLQAITPQTGLCEKGHLPWEMRDGQVRIVSEGACPQCGEWVEPVAAPTHFDWVRAAQVAATETKNVDFGDAAPIPIVPNDIQVGRQLRKLLANEHLGSRCRSAAADERPRGLSRHRRRGGGLPTQSSPHGVGRRGRYRVPSWCRGRSAQRPALLGDRGGRRVR